VWAELFELQNNENRFKQRRNKYVPLAIKEDTK